MRFEGRVAIVTGAGSGMGAAISRQLAAEGAAVAVWDVRADAAGETAEAITAAGGRALAQTVDVASVEQVREAAAAVAARLGAPAVLVNSAGVTQRASLLELDFADWRRVLSVNLDGTFICTVEAGRLMAAAGNGGAIVNLASTAGLTGYPNRAAYVSSKSAVIGLTRASARDLAAHRIRVNAVAPGHMRTPLTAPLHNDPAVLELIGRTPVGRWGEPEEVARVVCFLASDEASFMSGEVVAVDGGLMATG